MKNFTQTAVLFLFVLPAGIQAAAAAPVTSCTYPDFAQTRLSVTAESDSYTLHFSSQNIGLFQNLKMPWAIPGENFGLQLTQVEAAFPKANCVLSSTNPGLISCHGENFRITTRQVDWRTQEVLAEAQTFVNWFQFSVNLLTTLNAAGVSWSKNQVSFDGYGELGGLTGPGSNLLFSCQP